MRRSAVDYARAIFSADEPAGAAGRADGQGAGMMKSVIPVNLGPGKSYCITVDQGLLDHIGEWIAQQMQGKQSPWDHRKGTHDLSAQGMSAEPISMIRGGK